VPFGGPSVSIDFFGADNRLNDMVPGLIAISELTPNANAERCCFSVSQRSNLNFLCHVTQCYVMLYYVNTLSNESLEIAITVHSDQT
jgi:hypothetical protein